MKDADQQIIATLREIKARIEAGGGGGAAWGAITGTLSAQTDLQAALDAKPGYKVYTALLTQSGTDAPVATVLQNTFGGTVVWTYDSTGTYVATLAGFFTTNKTAIFTSNVCGQAGRYFVARLIDTDSIMLYSVREGAGLEDGDLATTPIEIRVYP